MSAATPTCSQQAITARQMPSVARHIDHIGGKGDWGEIVAKPDPVQTWDSSWKSRSERFYKLRITGRSNLPVLLVSLFNRHDFINPYHVGIDIAEQGIFQRYMHPPTGFFSMESLDIP